MKITFLMTLAFVGSLATASEKGTVEQMKGKKAIIRFDNDIPFSVGQAVFIETAEGAEIGLIQEGRNLLERKNSVSLSSELSNLSTKVKGVSGTTKTTTYSVSAKYGWNQKQFEFGPVVNISQSKIDDTEETSLQFGGFFEFNLTPNIPGQDMVWGPYAELTTGTLKVKNNGVSESVSPINLSLGGFGKWFVLSPVLAFRLDGAYQYTMYKKTTTNGLVFGVGLNHYF